MKTLFNLHQENVSKSLGTRLSPQVKKNQLEWLGDAPLVDQPKSHDIQKVLKLRRDQFEALEDYCLVFPSKSLAFLTFVA